MVKRIAGSHVMRDSDNTETYLLRGGTNSNTNSLTLTGSHERSGTAGFGSHVPDVLVEDMSNTKQKRRTLDQDYSAQPQSETRSTFPLDRQSPHRSSINRLDSIREELKEEQTSIMSPRNDSKTANEIVIPPRISQDQLMIDMKKSEAQSSSRVPSSSSEPHAAYLNQ